VRLHDGTLETPHDHDWKVRAQFARRELDEMGMVFDFSTAQDALNAILTRLHGTDLNTNAHLDGLNPTAEVVAKYIFECLAGRGLNSVFRVEVTEAPGCVAAFECSEPIRNRD
jgi:6-pyruvoyltetrahydropterin/6-carboxytetrahydropterin synthase